MDMMTVSNFRKDSDDEWAYWNAAHVVTHYRLFGAAIKGGFLVSNYPIDMEGVRPDRNWKEIHYQIHQSLRTGLSLGSVPFDMADVSFEEDDQFNDWHLLHALEHGVLNETLGLL